MDLKIELGPGWIEVDGNEWAETEEPTAHLCDFPGEKLERFFVYRPIVLPRERDTMIEPHWKPGTTHTYTRLVLLADGRWWRAGAGSFNRTPEDLVAEITGFAVVAEPVSS